MKTGPKPRPAIDRFSEKHTIDPVTGCWDWVAAKDRDGYGRFSVLGESPAYAHRWSYQHHAGVIPFGLVIDHLCRNRSCVNPGHLEPVTQRENNLRGEGVAAAHVTKTVCPAGHEYNEVNTYAWRGMRMCRTCRRLRAQVRRDALKEVVG